MRNLNDASVSRASRSARKRAAKLGLAEAALTITLCGDEKTAKCASACDMRASWKHLRDLAKARRKQWGQRITILRIACPGVCRFGPIAGVFPSGQWYGGCDPKTLERIVDCHLSRPSPAEGSPADLLADHRITPSGGASHHQRQT